MQKWGTDMTPRSATSRSFAVVTDSTADIVPEMALEHDICVVPLTVTFGDESFADGVLTQQQFFDRMNAAATLPTTSQPSIGAFVEAYGSALETADHVVSVHISSRLSGTLESARSAAEQFTDRVRVFDSRNLSWGLGWQVVDAAQAAAEGLAPEDALVRLTALREQVKMIVGVDSLDNLSRGGRIGKVSMFLGSLLNLKVTFTVDADGAFQPVARSRGEKAALKETLEWVGEQMGQATRGRFAVGHAMSPDRAHQLADTLRARYDVVEMVVYAAGTVISTHTGPGWSVVVVPGQ
jgi:DegV family protein with EDD domain